jgi:hypothetical protein
MMRIKDVNSDAIKLRMFPFSLRGEEKDWLLLLPKGTITSWDECTNIFMIKFFPPAQCLQKKLAHYFFYREYILFIKEKNLIPNCNSDYPQWEYHR